MTVFELMERHVDALYESDARGRSLRSRSPSSRPAARFHLARTVLGNSWRLRADLPADVAIRLAALAGKEPPLGADVAPPEREEFFRRALEESEPIRVSWAGPVFAFPETTRSLDCGAAIRELSLADVRRVHPELALSEAHLGRAGCVGADVGGEIVAVCQNVRGDGSGAVEAGVATAVAHRRRGYGAAVVSAWAELVRARGGEPIYSTEWANRGSVALATSVGLFLIGEDRHWR